MSIENELMLGNYLSILKRRWKPMVGVFVIVFVVSVALAFLMPAVYRSQGVISVEAQRISTDLVKATSVAQYNDELIDRIKGQIMSKKSLDRIIRKYDLFPNEADPKKAILEMTKNTSVDLLTKERSPDAWTTQKVTVAFVVGFQYKDPELTHKVANELVTLFLDENVKFRAKRATETTEFFTGELSRLKSDLDEVENKVAAYKQAHANALPELMQMHMNMLQNLESDIKEVDRDYKSTQEELRYLDVELTTNRTAIQNKGGELGVTLSELEKAKAELERSLVLYKETHPTIRALKRKIEGLEKVPQSSESAKPKVSNAAEDLVQSKIQTQIEAAKVRLASLADQKRSMLAKMRQLQSQIEQTPQVERGLFTLLRDYENAKAKYEEVKSKQVNAKIAENLEAENKAERFLLLEAPEYPDKRFKPVRKNIVGGGVLAGLALAVVLAALLEVLDKTVRNEELLSSIINMRPLVVVPYITTKDESTRNKTIIVTIVSLIIVGLLLLAIIHFLIVPLV